MHKQLNTLTEHRDIAMSPDFHRTVPMTKLKRSPGKRSYWFCPYSPKGPYQQTSGHQPLGIPNDLDVISIRMQMDSYTKTYGIVMYSRTHYMKKLKKSSDKGSSFLKNFTKYQQVWRGP